MTTPTSVPLHLVALEQAATHPGDAGGPGSGASEALLRSAIVNVARYYLALAQTRTPAQMQALIWDNTSMDGAGHGPSGAAFASLTLELAARAVGQHSWATGGTSYPWPLPAWADVRANPNPASPGITSIVQDAQAHGRWHPLGDGYAPQPGDWVVFHGNVQVVTGFSGGALDTISADSGPDLTVSAHSFPSPLAAAGAEGYVDNGHLASAATPPGPPAGDLTPPQPGSPGGTAIPGNAAVLGSTSIPGDVPAANAAVMPGAAAMPGATVRPGGAAKPGATIRRGATVRPGVTRRSGAAARARAGTSAGTGEVPGTAPIVVTPAAAPTAPAATPHTNPHTNPHATPPATQRAGRAAGPYRQHAAPEPALSQPAPAPSPAAAQAGPAGAPPGGAGGPGTPAEQAFISQVAPGAMTAQQRYGVPAAVTIAQAIEESGWGHSELAARYHNLFGIKGTGPAGSVTLPTSEYEGGQWVTISAPFRVYHDVAQSIADHAELLATSGYYQRAMADRAVPDAFASDLTGVYATDPGYGANLITLMRRYDLYRFGMPARSHPAASASARAPRPAPAGTAARAARYTTALPPAVVSAFFTSAKAPLRHAEHLYREVAGQAGIRWELLAACDWMQCRAHPRYSPVHGEKLGTLNADATCYGTKSQALAQCASDLTALSAAVYGIDLTAPRPLSVRALAEAFAAFRWGGLLRRHRVSALEFPYSVAGLTQQHLKMHWPAIDAPEAPDRPGARYRAPFGAVPVVISLGYPVTVLLRKKAQVPHAPRHHLARPPVRVGQREPYSRQREPRRRQRAAGGLRRRGQRRRG